MGASASRLGFPAFACGAGGALAFAVGMAACSTSNHEAGKNDGGRALDGGAIADAQDDLLLAPNLPRPNSESALAPMRASCAFDAGAWAAETIGNEYPVGTDIPINHVLVIMEENRSFDHYLGRLVAQGYYQAGDFTAVPDGGSQGSAAPDDAGTVPGSGFASSTAVDVPPPGWSNSDGDGGVVVPHADDEYCYSVDHSWGGQHFDWDNGKNDNFVIDNQPDGQRTLFYEDDTVIPFYYGLANAFSVGDRYFCSALTSTWPNRYFLMAATSFGIGDNSIDMLDTADNPSPQIFSLLEAAGHSWKDYTDGPHMEEFFPNFGIATGTLPHYGTVDCDLLADIASGTLPDVSFMMGDELSETSDEGPPALPGIGGSVVETIIRTLWASPLWKDTAVFITYDENGGLADHVPPAPACAPDGYAPHDENGNPLPGAFDTTGFRVPFIVVSPYAKAHFASHVVHDHTSITRFIEARFGLPALTARDANATPPFEMFDFDNPPFMTPPTLGGTTTVPPAVLMQCKQSLAPTSCPSGN